MKEQMKEEKNELKNPKKIRWNISMAMSCVFAALNKSKLKPKKSKKYTDAMERLKEFYKLTGIQVWILCLICEHYVENDDTSSLCDLSNILEVPAMSIMGWRKELDVLLEKRFLMRRSWNGEFLLAGDFCNSIYNNTEYIPPAKKEMDETEFLSTFAERYESRTRDDLSASRIQEMLDDYEHRIEILNW